MTILSAETLIYSLDLASVFVFALSGAVIAARKRLDVFGFIVVATVTALGGGTLRDLLLDRTPVFWTQSPVYLFASAFAALLVSRFGRRIARRSGALRWADAAGLAIAAAVGVEAAHGAGVNPVVVVAMAVMTGTFGGLIRDVLCNEIPLVLRQDVYASAAAVGASAHIALIYAGLPPTLAAAIGAMITLTLRGAAIRRSWSLPAPKSSLPDDE